MVEEIYVYVDCRDHLGATFSILRPPAFWYYTDDELFVLSIEGRWAFNELNCF